MSVDVPPKADDWPFEAKRSAVSEANTAAEIREEIDDILGDSDPRWFEVGGDPGQFTKGELAMLLLALGGPQGVDA